MSVSDTYASPDDPVVEGKREPGDAGPWKAALEKAEKAEESWRARAEKIVKLYRNQESISSTTHRRFAMLWANTEVLRPSVYDRSPQPVVTRRFKDRDPVGREASEMLERVLSTENDLDDDDAVYREVRDEFLLVGRGVARVRYEPQFGQDEYKNEIVVSEKAPLDHVYWRDFLHGPARTWKEVPWVAFRSWLSKREWRERFGKKQDFIVSDQEEIGGSGTDAKQRAGKAPVWEIWCKQENLVKWVSVGHPKILDEGPPHLTFDGFWPCPKPVYATLTTDNLIPTPDYRYYQDQAQEIDDLTDRIGRIQDQLKLVGFYPGGSENAGQIERALEPGFENKMVAVDSWAAFSERGGVAQVVWLPMDMVINTLQGCIELRRQLIDDVYQITGIADIMRGDTDPNETLGAQQIKARNASIRIRSKQQEMARFTRDVQRLRTEIIAEHFQPQTLLAMSGKQLPSEEDLQQQAMMQAQQAQVQAMMQQAGGQPPTPPPGLPPGQPPAPVPPGAGGEPPVTIDAVMALLREDRTRGFRIDVETDSTIVTDEMQERGEWNEMMQAVAGFLQQAIQIVQVQPQMLPVMSELLLATVRRYRVGRSSEDVIEEALNSMQEQAKAAAMQPPQPSPEEQMAQAKLEGEQMKQEGAMQKAQMDMAASQQKSQTDAEVAMAKAKTDLQAKQAEHQMKLEQMQAETALKLADVEMKKVELELKAEEKRMDLEAKSAQAEIDMALGSMEAMAREREINQGMVAAGQKHSLDMETQEAKAKAAKDAAKAKPKGKP